MNNGEKQFHRSESVPHGTKRLIEMLDHVEERVELLRSHAAAMESERDALLNILQTIDSNHDYNYASEGEKEEICLTVQRLLNRTTTVEVSVTTPRNELQQRALNVVNKRLDDLLINVNADRENAKQVLQSYINACLSDFKGAVDQKFQAAILECAADDQKRVRKRLETVMATLLREDCSSVSQAKH